MRFDWETEEERLQRLMKIPARKKLEWLRVMNEFARSLPKKQRQIRLALRASR